MAKYGSRKVLQLLFVISCISSAHGDNMGAECNNLKEIQVYYKNYYDLYLGNNPFTQLFNEEGLFVQVLKGTVKGCCSMAKITFHTIVQSPTKDKAVEEYLLESMKADRNNPNKGIIKLFGPEYAYKKVYNVYDTQKPFFGLFRSPGPALIMKRQPPKDPVFVGEIFVKSWAITIFLITLAWIIGILVWVLVSFHQFFVLRFKCERLKVL